MFKSPYLSYNLHPDDFVRLARKHGTDKVLFRNRFSGEDQKDYVKRISHMAFTKKRTRTDSFSECKKFLLFNSLEEKQTKIKRIDHCNVKISLRRKCLFGIFTCSHITFAMVYSFYFLLVGSRRNECNSF